MEKIVALDLFAGTGWGVACKRLGIKEKGVEIMPEAIATREANGMETVYNDVWDGLTGKEVVPYHTMEIASPPCQTFSLAGNGAGRAALEAVIEAIETEAYKDVEQLIAFGERYDPRTALVLTPLAYAHKFRPKYLAWEQVPTVRPVWEACVEPLEAMGYHVKTAVLNSEQYGVPQTRKRAILVARWDGPVELPTPTHSRYYSRTPEKLDPGVQKWVSMAEALGWNAPLVLRSNYGTGGDPARRGERNMDQPSATITSKFRVNKWTMLRSNYSGTGGKVRGERTVDQPSATITSKADRNKWDGERNMSVEEAAVMQSYPTVADPPFIWCGSHGKVHLQIGNAVPPLMAEAVLAALIK